MELAQGNLFAGTASDIDTEHTTELLATTGLRLERIVSTGQASPPGFWYDQDWDEWVVLLAGSAGLQIEHELAVRALEPRRLRRDPGAYPPSR